MIKNILRFFGLAGLLVFLLFHSAITHSQVQLVRMHPTMPVSAVSFGADIVPDYGQIPLYFVPNEGQVNPNALFFAKTSRYTLWITTEGFIFDTEGKRDKRKYRYPFLGVKDPNRTKLTRYVRDILKLSFLDACPNPMVAPADTTDHKVSFFMGNKKHLWETAVSTSKAIVYKDLYEHIDLKVYGVEKQIEYDFIVRPGGDVSDIKFGYQGVSQTRIDGEGNLVIDTGFGQLRHMKPVGYQVIEGKRIEVEVRYRKLTNDIYRFEVEKYNHMHELVIDPLICVYSTYLGGSEDDYGHAIAVDGAGAVYVTGRTLSPDFPTKNPFCGSLSGNVDAFVVKIKPSGTALAFSTYLGGSEIDEGNGIAVDDKGAAYVTGRTSSRNFPTENAIYEILPDRHNAFVAKIRPNGTTLAYSTLLGGSERDYGNGIAVDDYGAAYVTGKTYSPDFPTEKPIHGILLGTNDAFVTKINPDGTGLVYSTYLGGNGYEEGHDIAVHKNGAVYVTGETYSPDFPILNPIYGRHAGVSDVFVTKINQRGTELVYSTLLGGWLSDVGLGIALHANGAAYVTGRTFSNDFPYKDYSGKSMVKANAVLYAKAFVAKVNSTGTSLVYSTILGGSKGDRANGIAVDESGAAYVAGNTASRDFPTQNPIFGSLSRKNDVFIAKLDIGILSEAPTLISPKNGAVLDNGRLDGRDIIEWHFDWSDYPGATKYHLYVIHVGAKYPVINVTTTRSSYHHISKGYIINSNRFNWTWKVRAGTKDSWLNWSGERRFNVEPLNTDPPNT